VNSPVSTGCVHDAGTKLGGEVVHLLGRASRMTDERMLIGGPRAHLQPIEQVADAPRVVCGAPHR
jgi:hypothetical protein